MTSGRSDSPRRADQAGVSCVGLGRVGQPVGGIAPFQMRPDLRLGEVAELGGEAFLGPLDPVAAPDARHASGDLLLGRVVEIAQQRRLPGGPHAGTDRPDVGDRQHEQQAQPFQRLHGLDEVADRLGVVDVAPERGVAHRQVPAHQPGHGLGLLGRQPDPRAEPERHLLADLRMVAAAPLADVVQQHRHVERAARLHGLHHPGGDRHLVRERPVLDPAQYADRHDGVLVDREDVIHVVLHLGHDAAEIGDEAAEHAGLVELPEGSFRVLGRGQHVEEQPVRLRILAQPVDQPQVARDSAQRARVDVDAAILRGMEQPQDVDRAVGERVPLGEREPTALDRQALGHALQQVEPGEREADAPGLLDLERGAEDAGQIADLLHRQVVVLHEAFDAARAGMVPCSRAGRRSRAGGRR